MSEWAIIYSPDPPFFESVEEWLDELSQQALKSVAKELRLLELCGNTLKLPHSRALGNGLFELRERQFGFRIYYCFMPARKIFLLHAGDKKTQRKDIIIAMKKLTNLER